MGWGGLMGAGQAVQKIGENMWEDLRQQRIQEWKTGEAETARAAGAAQDELNNQRADDRAQTDRDYRTSAAAANRAMTLQDREAGRADAKTDREAKFQQEKDLLEYKKKNGLLSTGSGGGALKGWQMHNQEESDEFGNTIKSTPLLYNKDDGKTYVFDPTSNQWEPTSIAAPRTGYSPAQQAVIATFRQANQGKFNSDEAAEFYLRESMPHRWPE